MMLRMTYSTGLSACLIKVCLLVLNSFMTFKTIGILLCYMFFMHEFHVCCFFYDGFFVVVTDKTLLCAYCSFTLYHVHVTAAAGHFVFFYCLMGYEFCSR